MEPIKALKCLIRAESPTTPYTTGGHDYVQYLEGTPYNKFGAIIALYNSIITMRDDALGVAGAVLNLTEDEPEFIASYHNELSEMIDAAKCVDNWKESHADCKKYRQNQLFNMALAFHMPLEERRAPLVKALKGESVYSFEKAFHNAIEKDWPLVSLLHIGFLFSSYKQVGSHPALTKYRVPEKQAERLLKIAASISPNLELCVSHFLSRTTLEGTDRSLDLGLHLVREIADSQVLTMVPFGDGLTLAHHLGLFTPDENLKGLIGSRYTN